jgi:hypothetical protein
VTAALQAAKGNIKLLGPHITARTKVLQNEKGEYEVRVVGDDGEFRGDNKGGFLTVGGLIEEFKKDPDFKYAFEAEGKGGSGAKPGQKRANGGGDLEGQDPTALINAGLQRRG